MRGFGYLRAEGSYAEIVPENNLRQKDALMSTSKTLLGVLLSALLPASTALAAGNDTLIYCSEASPESFNPQIASSGPSFVASSQVLYNRLINFDPVKNTPVPSLATEWEISPDGKTYTFTLREGVKFTSNKFFKPTRD